MCLGVSVCVCDSAFSLEIPLSIFCLLGILRELYVHLLLDCYFKRSLYLYTAVCASVCVCVCVRVCDFEYVWWGEEGGVSSPSSLFFLS